MQNSGIFQYQLDDLSQIKKNFIAELQAANSGEKTSLAFIRINLPEKSNNELPSKFQAMIIGGTNFESTTYSNSNGSLKIISNTKNNLDSFDTKESLLEFVSKNIDDEVVFLSLNFAYALSPVVRNNLLDGIFHPIGLKDNSFTGLEGKILGEEIEKHYQGITNKKISVTTANDTTCLVLSGLEKSEPSNCIGGIVGTGLNFGFFIDSQTIVNLESAGFDKFPTTSTGISVAKQSINKNADIFEKEVSGAYLYQHFNLSEPTRQINSTEELSDIAKSASDPDSELASELLKRSASLVACQIAGIYEFKQSSIPGLINKSRDLSPQKLTFVMEGSLFWQGWHYKQTVEGYIQKLGVPTGGIEFVQIKDSGLIGAAHLLI